MELTNCMKELTQNILSSSEERAEELTKIKEETVGMLNDFSASRREASRQLRQELAQGNTDRRKEVAQSLKNAQNLIQDFHDSRRKSGEQLRKELAQGPKLLVQNEKKRKQQVGKMLDAFQNSRRTMGIELKNDLGKNRDERKADVAGMRDGFRQAQAEVQADVKGAADVWKGMGSAIRKKTSSGKAAPGVRAKMPVEMTPNREEKLLSIINQHPKGITLPEVAKELGLVTIILGKAAKVLLEQGNVRKEEKTYFPVTR